MIPPSIAALFRRSTRNALTHLCPLMATLQYHSFQDTILFESPMPFHESRFQHFIPPLQTLRVISTFHTFSNLFPVPLSIFLHGQPQHIVLHLRPSFTLNTLIDLLYYFDPLVPFKRHITITIHFNTKCNPRTYRKSSAFYKSEAFT